MSPRQLPLLLSDWTRDEGADHADGTLLLLPVGSLEQHGPHLPAATDALLVEHVARAAAARARLEIPVVVAPTLPYGCSHHHLPFGVTGSLRSSTYLAVLDDLLGTFEISGFRTVFVLNGHGGNHEAVQVAVRDAALRGKMHLAAASYYDLVQEAAEAEGLHLRAEVPGHAGAFETSLVLALDPTSVATELPERSLGDGFDGRRRPGVRHAGPGPFRGGDGFSDSPAGADAATGQRLLQVATEAVAVALRDHHDRSGGVR